MTHLHVALCSIGGQTNNDQQHVTHTTSDLALHANSTNSHTGQYCAQNHGKKTDVTSAW